MYSYIESVVVWINIILLFYYLLEMESINYQNFQINQISFFISWFLFPYKYSDIKIIFEEWMNPLSLKNISIKKRKVNRKNYLKIFSELLMFQFVIMHICIFNPFLCYGIMQHFCLHKHCKSDSEARFTLGKSDKWTISSRVGNSKTVSILCQYLKTEFTF